MSNFRKGDKVRIYLSGAGVTTSDETAKVMKVSKGMVYTDDSGVPYFDETGDWKDNGIVPGFHRSIRKESDHE